MERRPPTAEVLAAALDAALAEIAEEAFVVGADGTVLYTNPAGRSWISDAGEARALQIASSARRFRCCALPIGGGATGEVSYLMFVPRNAGERITAMAARRWSLTRRQTEVLMRMLAGDFNKEIASALACSRRAVEHHITAILRKTRTHSRSELLAFILADVIPYTHQAQKDGH